MRKLTLFPLTLFLLALAAAQQLPPRENVIDVAADGQFEADPDTAVLSFQVQARDKKLRGAYADAQKQADQVRALLRQNGIAPEQAQLGNYQVQPIYLENNRKPNEYIVSSFLTLRLTDFSKIGDIVDAAGEQGLPALSGVSFELKNPDAAKTRALTDAFNKARREATTVAEAAGRRLGELVAAAIEMPEPPRPIPMYGRMTANAAVMAAPTAEFTPQRVTVTAHVAATFRLAPQ